MKKTILSLVVVAAAVSACSRAGYETTPVKVQTAKGTVTCQLYTFDRVLWDEAIAKPEGMTTDEANTICERKGAEVKATGRI